MKPKIAPTSPKTEQEHQEFERLYTEHLTTIQRPSRVPVGLTLTLAFVLAALAAVGVLASVVALGQRLPEGSWLRFFTPGGRQTVILGDTGRQITKALTPAERQAEFKPLVVGIYEDLPTVFRSVTDLPSPAHYRGNGLVVSSTGLVVTTKDVVPSPSSHLSVLLADHRVLAVTDVVPDPVSAFVFLSVSADNLNSAKFASRDDVTAGLDAFAYSVTGMPDTFSFVPLTVAAADVRAGDSGDVLVESSEVLDRLLLASRNDLEPGTAVADVQNDVIGLALKNTIGGRQAIAPIWQMTGAFRQVLRDRTVVRPWLGVSYLDVGRVPGIQGLTGAASELSGALVTTDDERARPAVEPKSPAAAAKLKAGDLITKVNSTPIGGGSPLNEVIQDLTSGETVNLIVRRGDVDKTIKVTLGVFRP